MTRFRQAIAPAGLSDAELSRHLEVLHAHAEAMITLHHRYTITCIIATGDYLAHVMRWTGARGLPDSSFNVNLPAGWIQMTVSPFHSA